MKRALLIAFVVLQILDVLSTVRFLHNGTGVEANPIMALAMVHLGPWWWTPKLGIVICTLPMLVRGRMRYVAILNGWYTFVVVNNFML